MTEEDGEHYENNNICRFCHIKNLTTKIEDHCHVTGVFSGPAHNICDVNLQKAKVILFRLYFTILVAMIVILLKGK